MNVRATAGIAALTVVLAACTSQQAVQQAGGSVLPQAWISDALWHDDFNALTGATVTSPSWLSTNKWQVTSGQVNVVGAGSDTWKTGFCDPSESPNTCVDLSGDTAGQTDTLTSEPINLVPGNYRVSFKVAASFAGDTNSNTETLNVVTGTDTTDYIFTREQAGTQEFVTQHKDFAVNGADPTSLAFTSTNDDNRGIILDDVQVQRIYGFAGFFAPINSDRTALNIAKAGQSIPLKFSFGVDGLGLNILDGTPVVQEVNCANTGTELTSDLDPVINPGGSGLSYDATTMTYNYVWKTAKSYAGKCIALTMNFVSGDPETAYFKFFK